MFLYSTVLRSFFWIVMGVCYTFLIIGAPLIAKDMGLEMNWWKWCLALFWYVFLTLGVAASFTLMGEKEPGAGRRLLILSVSVGAVLGGVVWLVFSRV